MANPVMNFEIVSQESKSLKDFYSAVFEWDINEYAEDYYWFKTGSDADNGIEGTIYPLNDEMNLVENVPFSNNVTIYVAVADINTTIEKLVGRGGKVLMQPTVVSDKGEKIAMFIDPSGNRIGLYQQ